MNPRKIKPERVVWQIEKRKTGSKGGWNQTGHFADRQSRRGVLANMRAHDPWRMFEYRAWPYVAKEER